MKNSAEKYHQAKEQVDKIKSFYTHLAIYLAVNIALTSINIYHNGFNNVHFGMFSTWFFWGIGVAFHALGVFGKNVFFGKNWEKRKIQELMNDDQNEVQF